MNRRRVNLENCLYGNGTERKISVEGDLRPPELQRNLFLQEWIHDSHSAVETIVLKIF